MNTALIAPGFARAPGGIVSTWRGCAMLIVTVMKAIVHSVPLRVDTSLALMH